MNDLLLLLLFEHDHGQCAMWHQCKSQVGALRNIVHFYQHGLEFCGKPTLQSESLLNHRTNDFFILKYGFATAAWLLFWHKDHNEFFFKTRIWMLVLSHQNEPKHSYYNECSPCDRHNKEKTYYKWMVLRRHCWCTSAASKYHMNKHSTYEIIARLCPLWLSTLCYIHIIFIIIMAISICMVRASILFFP